MNVRELKVGSLISGPVLVTGHTGFKGAWFTELLSALAIDVSGYSLKPQPDSLYEGLNHKGVIREKYADIRDLKKLSKFVSQVKPEVIFHFAAQPLVLESYKDPINTFTTNVTGTANLLEAGFKCESVKTIIVVTTDKVYENLNSGSRFKESDPLMGKDPYSASKVGTEQAVAAWRQISKVYGGPKVVAVRAGNVIGGGDISRTRLLPDLVQAFSSGDKVAIRNPESTRPWQHVLDPLIGYLQTAEHSLQGNDLRALNFSNSSTSLSVKEVVQIASRKWGNAAESLVTFSSTTPDESEALALDLNSALAESILGWKSRWSQEQAITSTIEWWVAVKGRGKSPREACLVDLEFALRDL